MTRESDAERGVSTEQDALLEKPDAGKGYRSAGLWAIAAAAVLLVVAAVALQHGLFRGSLTYTSAVPPPETLAVGPLAQSLPAAVSGFYGAPDMKDRDDPAQYLKEGGEKKAQIYGEVTPRGMYAMLSHAFCLAAQEQPSDECKGGAPADDETVKKLAPQYKFFDLGSGFGKFPAAAALLGFQSAKGVELDTKRAGLAKEHREAIVKKYPHLGDKLTMEQGSFLDMLNLQLGDWTKGTERRVIFLDAVFFDPFWPQLSELMKTADWGAGTVVIALGHKFVEAESGLKEVSESGFQVSWSESSPTYFYKRA